MEDLSISPHILRVHSYVSPHFCDLCGEMLFGLIRQGLKCEGCGQNFHKRCAFKIPNNCLQNKPFREEISAAKRSVSLIATCVSAPLLCSNLAAQDLVNLSGKSTQQNCLDWSSKENESRVKVPHTFVIHNYAKPTTCQECRKLLHGLFRQGLQCKDCHFNCHKKCAPLVNQSCKGEETLDISESDRSSFESEESIIADIEDNEMMEVDNDAERIENINNRKMAINSVTSTNIPLMRVIQSVKHTKRTGSNIIREGWMVHYTNKQDTRRRFYWKLDTSCITLFQDNKSNRYFTEISLCDIISVTERSQMQSISDDSCAPHVFEISTTQGTVYYVGEDPTYGGKCSATNIMITLESGIGVEQARAFELALRQALMPMTSKIENAACITNSVNSDSQRANVLQTTEIDHEEEQEISVLYQIIPDDVLGSGQFGIVYGSYHRKTGREVAIKVIDKLRFPTNHEAQLKNEVSILQNLHHPGVVNLERMFETSERIFVVMEKMKGDMLEMILSSSKGRLEERITKFIISQILVALRHLHSKSIVHCDLKPENVLLTSNSMFPKIKLCDFGFARIIGNKSFRRSIVGTPAYLAPEVIKNRRYNRSIDLWSVGVIIYVSLSGTFPFNEDEDVVEQIENADFMYPDNPWKEISHDARTVITQLLEIKLNKRLSVDKTISSTWLQDYQCWCDLRKLEAAEGKRFLTFESDDEQLEEFRRSRNLKAWTELGQITDGVPLPIS